MHLLEKCGQNSLPTMLNKGANLFNFSTSAYRYFKPFVKNIVELFEMLRKLVHLLYVYCPASLGCEDLRLQETKASGRE